MTLMDQFIDTRDGWRETTGEKEPYRDRHAIIEYDESGKVLRSWVQDEPLPPLPTAAYTVIRVTWREGVWESINNINPVLIRQPADAYSEWAWSNDGDAFGDGYQLLRRITEFEVLSWPVDRHSQEFERQRDRMLKRTTARAVIERIASEPWAREVDLQKLRDEFEVTW